MAYDTEADLRWKQVQRAIITASSFAIKEDTFHTLSNLQEAEIILRSIVDQEENKLKRELHGYS